MLPQHPAPPPIPDPSSSQTVLSIEFIRPYCIHLTYTAVFDYIARAINNNLTLYLLYIGYTISNINPKFSPQCAAAALGRPGPQSLFILMIRVL